MYFVYSSKHNQTRRNIRMLTVNSITFDDGMRSLLVNGVELVVEPEDYDYAKDTLLRCIVGNAPVLHEDVLTDGNASLPTFDPVYESIKLIKQNSVS